MVRLFPLWLGLVALSPGCAARVRELHVRNASGRVVEIRLDPPGERAEVVYTVPAGSAISHRGRFRRAQVYDKAVLAARDADTAAAVLFPSGDVWEIYAEDGCIKGRRMTLE